VGGEYVKESGMNRSTINQAGERLSAGMKVMCVLLLANAVIGVAGLISAGPEVQPVYAQTRSGGEPPTPFPNSGDLTRRTNEALTEISQRLSRLEARLERPLNVKVLEMPPVIVSNPSVQSDEARPGQ